MSSPCDFSELRGGVANVLGTAWAWVLRLLLGSLYFSFLARCGGFICWGGSRPFVFGRQAIAASAAISMGVSGGFVTVGGGSS